MQQQQQQQGPGGMMGNLPQQQPAIQQQQQQQQIYQQQGQQQPQQEQEQTAAQIAAAAAENVQHKLKDVQQKLIQQAKEYTAQKQSGPNLGFKPTAAMAQRHGKFIHPFKINWFFINFTFSSVLTKH